MIQKKKYAKAAKIIPDGYESANHFFEAVFKDKEMIWMGIQMNCILVTTMMYTRQ